MASDGEEINVDKRRRRTETTNRQWMKLGIEKKHKLADARNCDILRYGKQQDRDTLRKSKGTERSSNTT